MAMKLTSSMMSYMTAGTPGFQNNIDASNLEPDTYTIQFGVINIEPSPNLHLVIHPIVQAIVTWKIEGQQQRRVVSVVSGAALSGVCQAVDVKIIDIDNAEDNGYKYQVQVTLSRGVRANTQQPPQLSRGRFVLIPTLSLFAFDVPQDSGVISCFTYLDENPTINPQDIELRMIDAVGNTVANITPAPNGIQWIPIVPGTTQVQIVNSSASGLFANLIWGVDG